MTNVTSWRKLGLESYPLISANLHELDCVGKGRGGLLHPAKGAGFAMTGGEGLGERGEEVEQDDAVGGVVTVAVEGAVVGGGEVGFSQTLEKELDFDWLKVQFVDLNQLYRPI